jgi:hypothetical protein
MLLICGEGYVDVLTALSPGSSIKRVATAPGARTGLLAPEMSTLFVAVPARSGQAAIWMMGTGHQQ